MRPATLLREYGAAYSAGWGDFVICHANEMSGQTPRSFETFASELLIPARKP